MHAPGDCMHACEHGPPALTSTWFPNLTGLMHAPGACMHAREHGPPALTSTRSPSLISGPEPSSVS
eukprot:233650-Chlamydomonas_euryale.AAC.3